MEILLQKLKEQVTQASLDSAFVHHEWFVKYHLNFVEQIALELCGKYPEADKDLVLALVWAHDYGKILDKENEHSEVTMKKVKQRLLDLGFERVFVERLMENLAIFEKKMETDLNLAPIEVKIVSSADGASHLVGPFFSLYYKENSGKSVEELMEAGRKKLVKDWERKIVLPEVKAAFEQRYKVTSEQAGNFPEKFLL